MKTTGAPKKNSERAVIVTTAHRGVGDGYGSGYGSDLVLIAPAPAHVSVADLERAKACSEGVRAFKRLFPDGATWPADIDKARAAGLDVEWATKNLGLLVPR